MKLKKFKGQPMRDYIRNRYMKWLQAWADWEDERDSYTNPSPQNKPMESEEMISELAKKTKCDRDIVQQLWYEIMDDDVCECDYDDNNNDGRDDDMDDIETLQDLYL